MANTTEKQEDQFLLKVKKMKFLQNMSLKNRFFMILTPAILSLISLSFLVVKSSYHEYVLSNEITITTNFLARISGFIHEVQKERMISMGFLKDTFTTQELQNQREVVNAKIKTIKEIYSELHASDVKGIEVAFKDLEKARKDTDAKTEGAKIFSGLSLVNSNAMKTQSDRVKLYSLEGMDSKLLSVPLLETAKEATGKLRAKMVGVLSINQPVPQTELQITKNY